MQRPPSIPFSIIRELRCRNCQNVVSCGPVHVVPDESILCGRCKYLAKDIYRNISFEALASMFIYPCQNWEDHCPRILQWNECLMHEGGCSYSGGCGLFWKHPRAFLKGRREMPYGDIRLIPVPEGLLDQIKCVLCESYLSCEPVFIRTDGRNICHRCIHSNGVPADCVRNVSYEILSNIIIFPCVFRNRGCPTRLKFGSELWHHEAECSYNQMYRKPERKPERKPNQKERGVIKTHSGHYYGTITPYTVAFAPPSPTTEFDINKELVKSLKKQQERKILKAEEIKTNITRMSSEDGSLSDKANSYKSSSSGLSTPSRLDEPDAKLSPSPKAPASFNYTKAINNNYYENIYLSQIQDNDSKESRESSYNRYAPTPTRGLHERDENYDNIQRISTNQNAMFRNSSGSKIPLQDLDYNLLAGHYPIFTNPYGQGLIPKPSFKGVVRTDSLSSNRELIEELRRRQGKLKGRNEDRREFEPNPYRDCHNLVEILQVHDTIGE